MHSSNINLQHFKNLIVVAQSDGILDEYEKRFLYDKAIDHSIETSQLNFLIKNADDLKFQLPKSQEGKERELADVVSMSLADGIIHPNEKELCLKFAHKLGLTEDDLEMAIKLNHLTWKKSIGDENKIQKFCNLIIVAVSDNILTHDEVKFLMEKAKSLKIPYLKANQLIMNIDQLEFTIPKSQLDKEEELAEIVHLSLIDGELHDSEYQYCLKLAKKIGFTERELQQSIKIAKKLCSANV